MNYNIVNYANWLLMHKGMVIWYYDAGMPVKMVLLECSRLTEMDYTVALV